MSTWINKKLISISEKVIENVIDSFTNKNTPIENIQNIQGTQLGKIISKVISSKYFFKNDDICYNSRNLDFNWHVKNRTYKRKKKRGKDKIKRIHKKLLDERRRKINSKRRRYIGNKTKDENEDECKEDSYSNICINSKGPNYLSIDESYIGTSTQLSVNKPCEAEENEKEISLKKEVMTCKSSVQSVFSEIPDWMTSVNSNAASGYGSCVENTSDSYHSNYGANSDCTSRRSCNRKFRERSRGSSFENSAHTSLNLSTSESVSSSLNESLSLCSSRNKTSTGEQRESSLNSNHHSEARENYVMLKQSHLCKLNIFIKEAKLLFFNKNVSINDISIFVTTILEDKKYVGKLRKLSSRTLPMNNLIINEYINHNLKDIYSDIVINIKYKNRKKNNEEIILGRVIIPLFLVLNTYKYKIKNIRNKIKYCTKCFLWLHIFPCNNKLFNYKFFKPVEGFEEYGMLNPLYTLGFLNIKMRILFKKNPLFLTLYSNMRKPLFYYKLPIQFEPLYCQYYSENFFVYVTNLPIWVYKFFYIFNPKRVEMIPLNYYDYVFILSFWLFFFRLIVFSPIFHISVHFFFCLIFISLSYKYGKINYCHNMNYNFRPVQVKRRSHRNFNHERNNNQMISIFHPENRRNVHFFNKRREISLTANDVDSNYCCKYEGEVSLLKDFPHSSALSSKEGETYKAETLICSSRMVGSNLETPHDEILTKVKEKEGKFGHNVSERDVMIRQYGLKNDDFLKLIVTDDDMKSVPSEKENNWLNKKCIHGKDEEFSGDTENGMVSIHNDFNSNSSFNGGDSFYKPVNQNNDSERYVAQLQIEENCFLKESALYNNDEETKEIAKKIEKKIEKEIENESRENEKKKKKEKKGIIDFMNNTPDEINNKINNVTKFAKRLQNMMFDSMDKKPLDFFNVGSHGNGLSSLFNGINERRKKSDKDSTKGENSNYQIGNMNQGDNTREVEQEENYQVKDKTMEVTKNIMKGRSQRENDILQFKKKNAKGLEITMHKNNRIEKTREENEQRNRRNNTCVLHSSNKGEYTDYSVLVSSSCNNGMDSNVMQQSVMNFNDEGFSNCKEVNNSQIVNGNCNNRNDLFIPSSGNLEGEGSHCSHSNNSGESKFSKKNYSFDTFKNNLTSCANEEKSYFGTRNDTNMTSEKKDKFPFKKKYAFMPIVKSPFHNFYLCFSSVDNKQIPIFSNNMDVPNVHLLLKRFITLITLTQNFTGVFTMIYEKLNYAFNWDFTFYTFVNLVILFFICYGVSFILYVLSHIPLFFYRFLFFLLVSMILIKSYEFTEVGYKASLYYQKVSRKRSPWWRLTWRLISKKWCRTVWKKIKWKLKAKGKRDSEFNTYEEPSEDRNGRAAFIIDLVKRFFRSKKRSIQHAIVRNFQKVYKCIYKLLGKVTVYLYFCIFFLKNWLTRMLILKDIEHMKIAKMQGYKNLFFFIHDRMLKKDKNIQNFMKSNETSQSNGNKHNSDVLGGTFKRVRDNKSFFNEEEKHKNFLNQQIYNNYKNVESCIYSSSDKESLSVENYHHNIEHLDYEHYNNDCDNYDDDRESLSQLTDNGMMNVNVDIFLHYYFKKRKYDLFNNFININRNHLYSYKDINLLYSNDDKKINHINYAEYMNNENNYSSSYDNNKKKRF
ncbi:hypothetical protein, conserved [Plasmodium gonderi]|uniref:Uncharacterized protein n=1 Tax=Plasmodium gonderi TaxID=77519 RepID=A0A1Y1JII4_PLAGO|nr:hypothetical protein, conserved [Plasmodium gonderi]GAW81185.1 hypothetical protein, conserved [Plasmodium gonderi]